MSLHLWVIFKPENHKAPRQPPLPFAHAPPAESLAISSVTFTGFRVQLGIVKLYPEQFLKMGVVQGANLAH